MAVIGDFRESGLTTHQVLESRLRHGRNEVVTKGDSVWQQIRQVLTEPMVILLFIAALLYLISGETGDAVFMALAILFVTGISWYQEARSRKALSALKSITAATSKVIRNGEVSEIPREELVIGDYMVLTEGMLVPADGVIRRANDFLVNEAVLTGESLPVDKSEQSENRQVYQGTSVVGGLAICEVTAIGAETEFGRIGESVQRVSKQETPLQHQIRTFVRNMALVGIVIFLLVWAIHYVRSQSILDSLLKALTLAMSILPEEIPVAFTTFMALGAWRLMKLKVIVKHVATVESLGSATVICTDKTGTITENRMTLTKVYAAASGRVLDIDDAGSEERHVIHMAMWASEPIPFDPMEISLHKAYAASTDRDERGEYAMIHEYPLGGSPPMMTHVFEGRDGKRIIAAKGAPEALLRICPLPPAEKEAVLNALEELAREGYRVLGVAVSSLTGDAYPARQEDLPFTFLGLVAFNDPPKANIAEVFEAFYKAGIKVKIITGDNAETTAAIARQTGFRGADKTLSGEELVHMDGDELRRAVGEVNIFTRMFPEAKLKILNALKANGEVVAMTGDGVNDALALKAAHIGVAMGKKGTEIAKEVSSLVISDDDLSRMVDAVAMGRKIYANLKKAIQYIISIHIPIILTVFIPLVLGWAYPAIFLPVHVIFLELIMGPTCSIIYENEPIEENLMLQRPRPFTNTFFDIHELGTSIVQGLAITAATLTVYQISVDRGYDEDLTRTLVFVSLITANVFLTLVNRSFYYSVLTTIRYKNNLVPLIVAITLVLTVLAIVLPPMRQLFGFAVITGPQLAMASAIGTASVLWYEVVKVYKRYQIPAMA